MNLKKKINLLRDYMNYYRWLKPKVLSYNKFSLRSPNILFYPINIFFFIFSFLLDLMYEFFFVKIYYFLICSINYLKNLETKEKFKINKKKCYVIGNAYSLKHKDLNKIKHFDTFVVNNFTNLKNKFKPKYHVVLDDTFFSNLKKNILSNNNSKTKYIVPSTQKKKFDKFKSKMIYFDLLPFPIEEFIPKRIKFENGLPWAFNIIPFVIILAISAGYKEINILGVTQDQFLGGRHYLPEKKYFKGMKILKFLKKKRYHFDPTCSNKLAMWSNYRIYSEYEKIEKFASINNIKVYNRSSMGFLDVFKYKKI